MKHFYISVILFIINYFTDMSQISFSFIRHVTTVIVLFRKKEYFSLKGLKELSRNLKESSVSDLLFAIAEYSRKVACLICDIFEVMIRSPDSS